MSDLPTNVGIAAEVAGVSAANKATVVGAVTGAVGWASQVDWVGMGGVAIAGLGLLVNIFFQIRRDRREKRESDARILALRERMEQ